MENWWKLLEKQWKSKEPNPEQKNKKKGQLNSAPFLDCFSKFWIREIQDVSVECLFFEDVTKSGFVCRAGETETPTLICRCLQALAEALKINASVTNIKIRYNTIGDEDAKAWCVVGSTESLNAAACYDVMFSKSSVSEKFGWFAGAVVSSLYDSVCRCWMKPWISGLFFQVLNQRDWTCLSEMSFFDQALICRCLQALAEALKINASVTTIDLGENQIGAEGAKAWCVVGSAEYSRMLRHVMM